MRAVVLVLVLLLLAPGVAVAHQEAQPADQRPMCAPVTLADLFPELYGEPTETEVDDPDAPDGEATAAPDDATTTTTTTTPPTTTTTTTPATTTTTTPATTTTTTPATTTTTTPATTTTTPPTTTAAATEDDPAAEGEACVPFSYEMLFPLLGDYQPGSPFGADRTPTRKHAGVDLAAPKMSPIVAVSDGVVVWVRGERGGKCCGVKLRHPDGWFSLYLHLNNDTFGTDDGIGFGLAPGLDVGTEVTAGTLLGWVGDSGNAEDTTPHLHFELRDPNGVSVDPRPSLDAATPAFEEWPAFTGPFLDLEGNPDREAIEVLTSLGIAEGCDGPAQLHYCADDLATGNQVGVLLSRALDTEIRPESYLDYGGFPGGISLLGHGYQPLELLIGCGYRRYCGDYPITRGELATLLNRLFPLAPTPAPVQPGFASHFATITALGVFPADARPEEGLSRAELAVALLRSLRLAGVVPCYGSFCPPHPYLCGDPSGEAPCQIDGTGPSIE